MSSDNVLAFKALAESRRCRILELIKEKPRTTGELCKYFEASLSRSRVMQYIGMLKKAGFIIVRSAGRYKLHYLNPQFLEKLCDGWISSYVGQLPTSYQNPEISDQKVAILKALANEHRRQIVDLLRSEIRMTTDLCKHFEGLLKHCTVVQHITVLRRANLITCIHNGRNQWNQLRTGTLKNIYDYLMSLYNSE